MIYYLRGKIALKKDDYVILENQGIGFKIFISDKNIKILKEGQEIKIYTFFSVKNEKVELYGFLSLEELKLFEIFEKISGIGPKAALVLSSKGTLNDFKKAIKKNDFSFFEGIKGVGKKKIQKIILEIGGEFKTIKTNQNLNQEALKILISLGFSRAEAKEALESISSELPTDKQVKKALQFLSKR